MSAPPYILESAEDGGESGMVLQGGIHRCSGSDAGRPAFLRHFERSGVCGSCHWVSVMVKGAEERGKRGHEGKHHNSLFYADDGMVASS